MNVTAVRVEELDQRIPATASNSSAMTTRPGPQGQASTIPNCQLSGVQPCFRDEICWPRQPWARQ